MICNKKQQKNSLLNHCALITIPKYNCSLCRDWQSKFVDYLNTLPFSQKNIIQTNFIFERISKGCFLFPFSGKNCSNKYSSYETLLICHCTLIEVFSFIYDRKQFKSSHLKNDRKQHIKRCFEEKTSGEKDKLTANRGNMTAH